MDVAAASHPRPVSLDKVKRGLSVKKRVERVLIVGLDGATLKLVEPWVELGYLPVLANLMRKGSYAPLRSVYPVLSSAAWSSFMTGLNPAKHGIYDFVIRDPESYELRPVSRLRMKGRSLWRMLSDHGLRTIVYNVPMTYPPESVNGYMVTGLGTPDYQDFTYPPEFGHKLRDMGYRINRREFYHGPGTEQAFLDDTYDISDRLTDSALHLMQEEEWDLFMLVYRDTDEVAHSLWAHMDETHPRHDPALKERYGSALLECYQRLDRALGQLLEVAGPNCTVLIVSDHGTGPLYKDVLLNEWLHQQGFLTPASEASSKYRRSLSHLGLTRANVSRLLRKNGLGRVEHWIKALLGNRIAMLPRDSWGDFADAIDWSHTKAYSYGYYGQIYLNVEGREPQGTLSPGDAFERVRQQIIEALHAWRDPADGQPVVTAVYTPEQIFTGPFISSAPDLTVIMRDLAYVTRHGHEFSKGKGGVFTDPLIHESGSHRLDGILIASGNGFAQHQQLEQAASLMDITPTVLHLFGLPIPDHLDGRVLIERLAPDWCSQEVQTFTDETWWCGGPTATPLAQEDEQDVVERLRNLGYL
jgi:predicted AlkP superfamily phosphohydrolase/phosphomutase